MKYNFKLCTFFGFLISVASSILDSMMIFSWLNYILEQNYQKPINIENLKLGLFLLFFSIFQNQKTLNGEKLKIKIQ
jgi:hypothetical protein